MPETGRLRNQVAIVGAAVAKSVRHSDRPVGSLAVEMSDAAIADAGLTRADIDGVACGTSLPADAGARITRPGFEYVNSDFLAEHMELKAEWSMDDGSFPPALARAAMAVASARRSVSSSTGPSTTHPAGTTTSPGSRRPGTTSGLPRTATSAGYPVWRWVTRSINIATVPGGSTWRPS